MKNSIAKIALPHFLIFLLMLFCANPIWAQTDLNGRPVYQASSPFDLALYSFRGEKNQNRVDVYLKLNNDMFTFIKTGEHFFARYLIVADFFDMETERMIVEKTWAESIQVPSYDETISKKIVHAKNYSLQLPAGNYMAMFRIIDQQTKQAFTLKRPVQSPGIASEQFSMSSLVLVAETSQNGDSTKKIFTPNFSGVLFEQTDVPRIFFEIYNHDFERRQVLAEYAIYAIGRDEELKMRYTKKISLDSIKTEVFENILTNNLMGGDYRLQLSLFASSPEESALAQASCSFGIRMTGLAAYIPNLDEAISQLQYIANYKQIEHILGTENESEKLIRFNDFWKKRDPSPRTEINELMAEFYTRVNYANQHFTHYMKGWRTDMGMIYIKYGAPDFVERHPFRMNTRPYEVWEFHQHRRRFIFVDINGFGDYRLATPEWDPANQLR